MKIRPYIYRFAVLLLLITALPGCGTGNKPDRPRHIRVGITSGPEQALAEAARKEALEKYGLEVELVTFNDYVLPNEALQLGDIDVNAFQHVPYLEAQSRQRGYTLAVVGKTFVYPIVAYSRKIRDITALKEGNTVAIPNDPTNGGRALLLLQKHGLLQLRDGVGLMPRITDITANPLRLEIREIEAPQLPRVLDDKAVSLAVINNNFAAQAGLDPAKEGILQEDRESPYVNVIVARADNKEQEKIKQFVKAYQSAAVAAEAVRVFKGNAVKGW